SLSFPDQWHQCSLASCVSSLVCGRAEAVLILSELQRTLDISAWRLPTGWEPPDEASRTSARPGRLVSKGSFWTDKSALTPGRHGRQVSGIIGVSHSSE